MAEKIEINRLTNVAAFINGNSLLGRIAEIKLPDVKIKKTTHTALGMIATLEFPSGIDKMDGKIKWNSFYQDVLGLMANPFKTVQLQVRGSLEGYASGGRVREVPVVASLTIQPDSLPGGDYKQNDNVDLETEYTANYFKLTVDSQDIIEVDVMANIYKANGEDVMANYRSNLGI